MLSLKIAFIAEHVTDALLIDKVVCRLNLFVLFTSKACDIHASPFSFVSGISFAVRICQSYRLYLLAVPRDKITRNP